MVKKKQSAVSKSQTILMISALAMLLVNFLVNKSFDVISALAYVVLAALFGAVISKVDHSSSNYLLYGALLSLIYNLSFSLAGVFVVTNIFIVFAAIQQALLAFVSAEIVGGGK